MSRYHYGVIAGFVALGIAAWQWNRSRTIQAPAHARGEVIFSNTPHPAQS